MAWKTLEKRYLDFISHYENWNVDVSMPVKFGCMRSFEIHLIPN